jgi:hypothetical protein
MEQEIDTNALERQSKKIKNNLPWDSCGYLWIRINLRCNGKYRLRSKILMTSPNCPVAESLPREVEEK